MRRLLSRFLYWLADWARKKAFDIYPKKSTIRLHPGFARLHELSGEYGVADTTVIEGHNTSELLCTVFGGAAVWAMGHPELATWIVDHGRYLFRLKFSCELRPLEAHEHRNKPVVGPWLAVRLEHFLKKGPVQRGETLQ